MDLTKVIYVSIWFYIKLFKGELDIPHSLKESSNFTGQHVKSISGNYI